MPDIKLKSGEWVRLMGFYNVNGVECNNLQVAALGDNKNPDMYVGQEFMLTTPELERNQA